MFLHNACKRKENEVHIICTDYLWLEQEVDISSMHSVVVGATHYTYYEVSCNSKL